MAARDQGNSFPGVSENLLQALKSQLSSRMSGLASSVLREKMLREVLLGEKYPSEKYSVRAALRKVHISPALECIKM